VGEAESDAAAEITMLLTRFLLEQGALDRQGMEEAIKAQVIYGGRIGTNLLTLNLVTEEQLCKALEKCYGMPSVLLRPDELDDEVIRAIPEKYIRAHKVLPFRLKGRTMHLAMANPGKRQVTADISFSTGYIIKPYVTPETSMDHALERLFDIPIPWTYTESFDEEVAPEDIQLDLRKPIPELGLEEAREKLASAGRGKEIPITLLGFAKNMFQRAILFAVRHRELIGLAGFSPGRPDDFAEGLRITLDSPSALADAAFDGATHRGPFGKLEEEGDVVDFLGGGAPKSALIVPVVLRGRTVNVLYGDAGPRRGVHASLDDLFLLTNEVAHAYEGLIRARVNKSLQELHKES
jgi:hypothetical protein